MPLDPHTRKFVKRCPGGCKRWVNRAVLMCGECANERTMEAIALANGIKLYKKRGGAVYLLAEHRANIAVANRRKAKQTGDNPVKANKKGA